jgi:hypothetical protein
MLMVGHIPTGWSEGEEIRRERYATYEHALEGHALVCVQIVTHLAEEEREYAEAIERDDYFKKLADEVEDSPRRAGFTQGRAFLQNG